MTIKGNIVAGNSTTVYVPGKVYWAKIVGERALHDNYDGDAKEWSYELVPDDASFLKEHRLLDRLKDKPDPKNPDKGDYLYLKKPELDKDGNKNQPIPIYAQDNSDWDGRLLGNGTVVVAKLIIKDWGPGKKKSIWTNALRVEDLVAYEGGSGSGFGDYDAETPKASGDGPVDTKTSRKPKPAPKKSVELDDLDDDMPF